MKLKTNINSVKLCSCRNRKNCPVISFNEDNSDVSIVDDYGGSVRMKSSEFLEIFKRKDEFFEEEKDVECQLDCGCNYGCEF